MHGAELQALVERDDTAARLPIAGRRLQEAGSEKCPPSTDVESAGPAAESADVRCDLLSGRATETGQLAVTCGSFMPAWRMCLCCYLQKMLHILPVFLWRAGCADLPRPKSFLHCEQEAAS